MTADCGPPERPDWRWQAIISGQEEKAFPASPSPAEGAQVNQIRVFVEALGVGDTETALFFEHLWWAHSTYEAGGFNRTMLEAALLTEASEEDLADYFGIPRRALVAYEHLFFNVRPYLANEAWIEEKVLRPSKSGSIGELYKSYHLRKLAYSYGWRAFRSYLDPTVPNELPDDIDERLLDSFMETLSRPRA